MTTRQKRIIAREFLILISVFALEIIFYCFIYFYNSYQTNKIEILEESTLRKNKSINVLMLPIDKKMEKQSWFFRQVSSEFDISNSMYARLETFWPVIERVAKKDSTEYRWNNKWNRERFSNYTSEHFWL